MIITSQHLFLGDPTFEPIRNGPYPPFFIVEFLKTYEGVFHLTRARAQKQFDTKGKYIPAGFGAIQ